MCLGRPLFLDSGKILLTNSLCSAEIADCFDKCIEKLIKAIRRQLQRGRKVDVSGLSNALFLHHLSKACRSVLS